MFQWSIADEANIATAVCRWSKLFFLRTFIKEAGVLTFLVHRLIFDHIFGPKLHKIFTAFVVHLSSCALSTELRLKYFMRIALHKLQIMKFSIKAFFIKCDQICSFLRIWSHLLKKPYCALSIVPFYYSETVFAMHYLTLSRAGSQFIFLRYDGLIGDLGGKYRQEQERGGLFWVWFSKFSLK